MQAHKHRIVEYCGRRKCWTDNLQRSNFMLCRMQKKVARNRRQWLKTSNRIAKDVFTTKSSTTTWPIWNRSLNFRLNSINFIMSIYFNEGELLYSVIVLFQLCTEFKFRIDFLLYICKNRKWCVMLRATKLRWIQIQKYKYIAKSTHTHTHTLKKNR